MSLFRPSRIAAAPLLALLCAAMLSACTAAEKPADLTTVVAWGDSLTLGFGAPPGGDVPSIASGLFSPPRTVENHGIGGQTSTQIAARMGALPLTATVFGGEIPAAGSVALTALSIDVANDTAFRNARVAGTLCGVRGSIGPRPERWTFTRAATGAATPCPARSLFVPDVSGAKRVGTVWLWFGRNGADPGRSIEADVAAAVAALGHERYLVAPVLTAGTDSDATLAAIAAINANLAATYGPRYVDVLSALLAGGNGGLDDTADIARGIVPRSLRWDFVHLTRPGNEIVAAALVRATQRLGF